MIKKVPNMICLFRIFIIPFILLFLLTGIIGTESKKYLIAGILFAVAMISDAFDGKIARKYNAVTNVGKFLDPIADKMLVLSILIAFVEVGIIGTAPVVLILAREFFITGLRLSALGKGGKVVAANMWGKIKTTMQGVSIASIFIIKIFSDLIPFSLSWLPAALIWITTVYTVISVIPYYMACKEYLKD